MDNCELTISTSLRVAFPTVTWRTDNRLDTPILFLPTDNRAFCLNVLGSDSRICLQWYAVPGATRYLVEWSLDEQFTGPSLREAIVDAPLTTYCLAFQDDIRQGDTVFWRIQAADNILGGLSAKSDSRRFIYSCGEEQNQNQASFCDEYDVQAVIKGRDVLSCCEYATYWLELSHSCKDAYGNSLLKLINIDWKTTTDDAAVIVPIAGVAPLQRTGVKTCATETRVFEVSATLTFQDKYLNTFECEATPIAVIADCGNPDDPDFVPVLKEKYRGLKKGSLQNCGTEAFLIDDCVACSPCCKEFEYADILTTGFATEATTVISNLNYDPVTCQLEYDLKLTIPTSPLDRVFEVVKSGGKTSRTTPNGGETSERWFFNLPADEAGEINLSYKGCWRYSDSPFFTILVTTTDPLDDPQDTTVTYFAGKYVRCINQKDCEEPTNNVAIVGGPVYAVEEVSCNDPWPNCTGRDCDCKYGRLAFQTLLPGFLGELAPFSAYLDLQIGVPVKVSIPLYGACVECEDGVLEVTLVSAIVSNACLDVLYTVEFKLFCRGQELSTTTRTYQFPCATFTETTSDGLGVDLQKIEVCDGCVVPFRVKNTLGTYPSATTPCDCVQDKISICASIGEEDRCIENVYWSNGKWILPSNTLFEIDTQSYSISKLYFLGCELWADLCKIPVDCNACLATCRSNCNSVPNSFTVDFSCDVASINQSNVSLLFTMNCEKGHFESDLVTVDGGPDRCSLTGRFYIEVSTDGFLTLLRFTGVNSTGGAVEHDWLLGEDDFDCDTGLTFATSIVAPCYLNGAIDSSVTIDIAFTGGNYVNCAAGESLSVELNVDSCLPLVASGTNQFVDNTEITITIGDKDKLTKCGCKVPGALEARVNLPLGCGLQVAPDPLSPNQNVIKVDFEALVGKNVFNPSLSVFYDGVCESLTLPICGSLQYAIPPSDLLATPPSKILPPSTIVRNLYKGVDYVVTASKSIARGDRIEAAGDLKFPDLTTNGFTYNSLSSLSFSSQELPLNTSGRAIIAGQKVILRYDDDCNPLIIGIYEDAEDDSSLITLEDDPNSFEPVCEGPCTWIWSQANSKWFLQNPGACKNLVPTTSTPTTQPPECDLDRGYCIITCFDNDGDGIATWQYIGRYDASATGHTCDLSEAGLPCTNIGETRCILAVPGATVSTTPAPEGCVYMCQNGEWILQSDDCQEGYECDTNHPLLQSTCDDVNDPPLVIPCKKESDCSCPYPTFCGTETGQCTDTICSKFVSQQQPNGRAPSFSRFSSNLGVGLEAVCVPTTGPATTLPPGVTTTPPFQCCVNGSGLFISREECCELDGYIIGVDDQCLNCNGGTCVWRIGIVGNAANSYSYTASYVSGDCPRESANDICRECFCKPPVVPTPGPDDTLCNHPCDWFVTTNCEAGCYVDNSCVGNEVPCEWLWDCVDLEWRRIGGTCISSQYSDIGDVFDSCGGVIAVCACDVPPIPSDPSLPHCRNTPCITRNRGSETDCRPCQTLPPTCDGICTWQATTFEGEYIWLLVANECEGNCVCPEPFSEPIAGCGAGNFTEFTFCQPGIPTTDPPTTNPPTTSPPTTSPPTTNPPTGVTCCVGGICVSDADPNDCDGGIEDCLACGGGPGACCEFVGPCFECSVKLQANCSGTFFGSGTDCGGVDCEDTPWACCTLDGSPCVEVLCGQCTGEFYRGSLCAPALLGVSCLPTSPVPL